MAFESGLVLLHVWPPISPPSHVLRVLPMFVSHRSGLVAVYDEAGFLGGSHVGLCGSGSDRCSLLEVPIFVCGFFSVAAELCIHSSC